MPIRQVVCPLIAGRSEAKRKLLAAPMCFKHRAAACRAASRCLRLQWKGLGRPRRQHALGPSRIIFKAVDCLPREASRLGDRAD